MKITKATLNTFSLPLRKPFSNSRETIRYRHGVLLQIFDDSGRQGLGEATPIAGFGLESLEESVAALKSFIPKLIASNIDNIPSVLEEFELLHPHVRCGLSALDTALCDLYSKQRGLGVARLFCEKPLGDFSVNALLSEQSCEALLNEARAKLQAGYLSFKLKVGVLGLAEDVARVKALRAHFGNATRIRLDANGAWGFSSARQALEQLQAFDIEFIEQPTAADDINALAQLTAQQLIPIAADESILDYHSAKQLIAINAADILMLKPSALGGPHKTMKIVKLAAAQGRSVLFSSLLDGAVARAMVAHIVAATDTANHGASYAHGLATGDLFTEDIAEGLLIKQGRLALPEKSGLGLVLNQRMLAEQICCEKVGG